MFSALGSGPRARILEAIAVRPRGIQELGEELRMPRATLRYHLAVLRMQGLIAEDVRHAPGQIGRPAKVYRAEKHVVVSSYPGRRFDRLSELALRALIEEVGEDRAILRLREVGRGVGESLVKELGAREGGVKWTPEDFERIVLNRYFHDQGAPTEVVHRSEDSLVFRTFHSPFLEMAEKLPRLVCDGLDAGVHDGIDRAVGALRTERMACMGHGSPYCEYRMLWPSPRRRSA